MCLSVYGMHRCQHRLEAPDTLELESRAIVYRAAGNWTWLFTRAANALSHWAVSPDPMLEFFRNEFSHLTFDYQHQFLPLFFCLFSHWNTNGNIAISGKNSPCQKNLGKKTIYKPRSRYNPKKMPLKTKSNRIERWRTFSPSVALSFLDYSITKGRLWTSSSAHSPSAP